MRNFRILREIADEATALFAQDAAVVLDIGCNDGTLLNCYPPKFTRYGVDPSDVAQQIKGDITVIQDVFPSGELLERLNGGTIDIITSIAMFYDLEDPIAFSRAIKSVPSPPDSIWVFEMSPPHMPMMLKQNSYDTICHEHIEYYSLAVIENIMARAGLKLFNVQQNNINGGSIRCYATHANTYTYKRDEFFRNIRALRRSEFDLELDTDKPYKHFQERLNIHREELSELLKKLKSQRKSIHIYGASTKGNTILQWCGIDHRIIDVAAERNPDKYRAAFRTLGDGHSNCQRSRIAGDEARLLSGAPLALQGRVSRAREGNARQGNRLDCPAADDRDHHPRELICCGTGSPPRESRYAATSERSDKKSDYAE